VIDALHRNPGHSGGPRRPHVSWITPLTIAAVLGIVVAGLLVVRAHQGKPTPPPALTTPTSGPVPDSTEDVSHLPTLEALQAVMVTVELDYGRNVPTIAEALGDIERRHQPDDGMGRTFAIIDAYGEPTDSGKLHLSMHVSAEKPGIGSLVFRRTGQVLWRNKILPAPSTSTFTGKDLTIRIDDGKGRSLTVDGSSNPRSILDATIKELSVPLRQIWPDGTDREVTFLYSACGCPVKVMVRRAGGKTARTSELPVIFPDDPAVVGLITQLMGW
jgi:hypothetical protein